VSSCRCGARSGGNTYAASLYSGLASLLSTVEPADIKGKQIAMLLFGSGCAMTYWSITVEGDTTEIRTRLDLLNCLASMRVVLWEEFVEALKGRAVLELWHPATAAVLVEITDPEEEE